MHSVAGPKSSFRTVLPALCLATVVAVPLSLTSASAAASPTGTSVRQSLQPAGVGPGGSGWQVNLSDPTITSTDSPGNASTGTITCRTPSVCYLVGDDSSDNGYLLTTTDSGASWNPVTLPPGSGGLNGIACPTSTTCYITTTVPEIFLTADAGGTWSSVTPPAGLGNVSGIVCPTVSSCYLVGGDGGTMIFSTTDSGATWNSTAALPPDFLASGSIACPSTTTCYDVGDSSDTQNQAIVVTTTDSGATWTPEYLPTPSSTFLGSPIACPSVTACFVSDYKSSAYQIQATTDSGSTWTAQKLPKDSGHISALACPSTSICYGVGENATDHDGQISIFGEIVVTTDSGATWQYQVIPSGTSSISAATCPSTTSCFVQGTETGTGGAVVLEGTGLSIVTSSLPGGTVGSHYSATLTASGGDPPYHWKLVPGSKLPSGLKLGATTGTISGTPKRTSTTSTFTVEVQDMKSKKPPVQNTATATFTITISPAT
jgi:hypothetical protein